MKLVFAGTPQVAVPTLERLLTEHDVAAVVTRPDAPLGRKRIMTPSPVAACAVDRGIEVLKAARLDDDATSAISALDADLGVIVAYGGLVREPLLSTPRLGWINLHFSLLPRWRGAAPVQWSILGGDQTVGASVFQLVPALDAGPIFDTVARRLGADETSGDLLASLANSGADLVARVVAGLENGTIHSIEQSDGYTLAPKITLEHARIDWSADRERTYRQIRAVTPEPGAFTELDGNRLKILAAARFDGQSTVLQPGEFAESDGAILVGTGTQPLTVLRVQPAGKTGMDAAAWWRGLNSTERHVAR
jgi:methionyl-tRNA formyltransferase